MLADIYFDPALDIYPLPHYEAKPGAKWADYSPPSCGITLGSALFVTSQPAQSVDELVRLAAKHIRDMGFIAINEQDERTIDRLVARQLAGLSPKPLTRKI